MNNYDEEFARAMKLKLDLNRQARSQGSGVSARPSAPSAPSAGSSFRDEIMRQVMEEHPGLTLEELDSQMAALGY